MSNDLDDGAALRQDETSTMPEAHLDALPAHQSVADGGQRAADADQVRLEQLRERAALERACADSERRHAAAAARARFQEELHGSHLDDLTSACRRETQWHALALEVDRSSRGDGRFVLAFLDIDGLKGINERAGHAAGDHVLRTLAATLRSSLRSFDPIVRFGDDRFLCGIGGVDAGEVERRLAATQRSLHADTGASFSIGLAVLAPGETLEQLTARADARLLDAEASRSV
ncbi:MAG: GGDEF domain-containing protein [Chloroflexi bacterium]|nr:GGDEF domain-containing protein [Chloroflexota bacterium]